MKDKLKTRGEMGVKGVLIYVLLLTLLMWEGKGEQEADHEVEVIIANSTQEINGTDPTTVQLDSDPLVNGSSTTTEKSTTTTTLSPRQKKIIEKMMNLTAEKEKKENKENENNVTITLKSLLAKYDRRIRPDFFGPPTVVDVTFLINNIPAIDEVAMHFEVEFYLRQSWRDPRLAFNLGDKIKMIGLSSELMDQIWRPDSYFANEKKSNVHSATVPNRFVRLYADGTLKTSTRLTLTASCPMNLFLFPMDYQVCSVVMGSYGYSVEHIIYKWSDLNQTKFNARTLPQFIVKGQRRTNYEVNYYGEKYSCLRMEFLFVRSLVYYVAQTYLPSFLVVTIAYFALWIGRDNPAPRLSLGVTTVLTMTTIYTATNAKSPPINYVKALDLYLGLCFVGVFTTLLLSVSISYMGKKVKAKKEKKKNAGGDKGNEEVKQVELDMTIENVHDESEIIKKRWKDKELSFVVSKLEVGARVFFPIIFLSFNLAYWIYFLNASQMQFPENYWNSSVTPNV